MRTMKLYRERRGGQLEFVRVPLWDPGYNEYSWTWRRQRPTRPTRREAVDLGARRGFFPKARFPASRRRTATEVSTH